ncbi:MAG: sulfite exporter TauE/SafE family protein [Clostridia bacterium]|nr:sulfite exporter TauE/SafE family protein [Clostridia bacterium]
MRAEISIRLAKNEFARRGETRKFQEDSKKKLATKLALYALAGSVIGVVNGLFGAGGGMLAVPALIFLGGMAERRAHATAILVMLPLCICSGAVYVTSSAVDFAVLIPTAVGVVTGGILGAKLLKFLPENLLVIAFNFLVILAGLKMIF